MENVKTKDAIGSNRMGALREERGAVLVIVLLVMVVISVLGVTLLTLSTTEQTIASNEQVMESAFFGAEAALAQAWNATTSDVQPPVPNTAKQQAVNCANPNYDSVTVAITGGTLQYNSLCATPTGGVGAARMTPMFLQWDPVTVCSQGGMYDSTFRCARLQINVQATAPGNSTRQIEAAMEFGPVQSGY